MTEPVPMHPSYEARSDVPDRDFALVDPVRAGLQISAWQRTFARVRDVPDLLHLHHLTPLTAAARLRWPAAPVLVSLHGTELKWLSRQQPGSADAAGPHGVAGASGAQGVADAPGQRGADPVRHVEAWAEHMRRWARIARYLTVPSEADRGTAASVLGIDPGRIVVLGSGVATDRFKPRPLRGRRRLAQWRRWLVDDPRGWDESCRPGSVRYTEADLAEFVEPKTGADKPVLLFVGRFTAVKRLTLLIDVHRRLRALLGQAAPPLVIWGGMPGEWEGTHPVTTVRRQALRGVFFIGMREHDDLPLGLNCSDLLVAPSVDESFGQVYVEALAAGIPVVATRTGGPATLVVTHGSRACGWLAAPDDGDDLLRCIVEALADPVERQRRGRAGRVLVESKHTWQMVVERLVRLYEACLGPDKPD
jgi:glycosyltransferase involved in cell wall biosynthesis